MNGFAFCNYIRFLLPTGQVTSPVYAFQNFFVNEIKTYNGNTYKFVHFAISTGAGSKGGDRTESTLGAGNNTITVNVFAEACDKGWLLEVKTVAIDPITLAPGALINSEIWRVSRYEMDAEKILLRLTSPLDAVRDQVPNRYLSTRLVGALPTSATLVVS